MPATTPLGIVYPCSGDTIDPGTFQDNAESIQDAISAVQTQVDQALRPPALQVRTEGAGQVVAAGVTTVMAYQLIAYDTAAMFNTATPTLITITSPGTYFVACWYGRVGLATTETSARIAILVNGVERAAQKYDMGTSVTFSVPSTFSASVVLPSLIAGDVITTNHLFTGTGNHGVRHAVFVTKMSNV